MFKYTKRLEADLMEAKLERDRAMAEGKEALLRAEARHVESLAFLRRDFESRLQEQSTVLEDTRLRLAASEAETERMRMVMMPLSSAAGAAYARSRSVQSERTNKSIVERTVPSTDWHAELTAHVAGMEKEIAAEEKKKSTEVKANGPQS